MHLSKKLAQKLYSHISWVKWSGVSLSRPTLLAVLFLIFLSFCFFLFSLYLFLFYRHYHFFIIIYFFFILGKVFIIWIISSALSIVRWIMRVTCLEIVAEICFQCLTNSSKLIDFCSAWNHQEILIFWRFVRGILVGWIAQFCLVAEENFGNDLLYDYRCF